MAVFFFATRQVKQLAKPHRKCNLPHKFQFVEAPNFSFLHSPCLGITKTRKPVKACEFTICMMESEGQCFFFLLKGDQSTQRNTRRLPAASTVEMAGSPSPAGSRQNRGSSGLRGVRRKLSLTTKASPTM